MQTEIPHHRFLPARQAPQLCGAIVEIAGVEMTCCGRPGDPEHERPPVVFIQPGDVTSWGPDCECLLCRLKQENLLPSAASSAAGVENLPVGVPPDEDAGAAADRDRRLDRAFVTGIALWIALVVAIFLIV